MATRRRVRWYVKVSWTQLAIRLLALLLVAPPFAVSYQHTFTVMVVARLGRLLALMCAALPDVLMAMSLVKITMKRPANHRVSYWVTSSFWFGLVLSVGSNAYATVGQGVPAVVVGVVLPVLVMLAVEMVRVADKTVVR